MRNPLTFRVESVVGALMILAISGFFVGLFYANARNFDSELMTLNPETKTWISAAKSSSEERKQMLDWVQKNDIELPLSGDQIRYLMVKYPERPWLDN